MSEEARAKKIEYARAWRARNRAKCKAAKKKWEAANPEKHLAYKRKRWAIEMANPVRREKKNAQAREYAKAQPAKVREAVKAWRKKQGAKWRAHGREYYRKYRYGEFAEASRVLYELNKLNRRTKNGKKERIDRREFEAKSLGNASRRPRKESRSKAG